MHFKNKHPDICLEDYFNEHVKKKIVKRKRAEKAVNEDHGKRSKTSDPQEKEGEKKIRLDEGAAPPENAVPSIPSAKDPDKKWYDGCEYQCVRCPLATESTSHMGMHIKNYHKIGSWKKGVDYTVVRESTVTCAICHLSITKNKSGVTVHLGRAHKGAVASIEDYEKRFVFGGEASEEPSQQQPENEMAPTDVEWYDRCLYKCKSCDYTSRRKSDINVHTTKKCPKAMAEGGPRAEDRMEMVRKVIMRCEECGEQVYHEYRSIFAHLKKKHGMSPYDYATKFRIVRDTSRGTLEERHWFEGSTYRCSFCAFECGSTLRIAAHLRTTHRRENGKEGNDFVAQQASMECGACGVTMLKTAAHIRPHLKNAHAMSLEKYAEKYVSGDGSSPVAVPPEADPVPEAPKTVMWYDRCRFQCGHPKCGLILWNEGSMHAHVKKCPWMFKTGGTVEMIRLSKALYKCKICGDNVEHKYGAIMRHLRVRHKGVSLPDYSEQYEN